MRQVDRPAERIVDIYREGRRRFEGLNPDPSWSLTPPLKDPAEPTVWPNRWSKANSDTSRDDAGKPMKNWRVFWFY